MNTFDPTKFGATLATPSPTTFDPTKFGATPSIRDVIDQHLSDSSQTPTATDPTRPLPGASSAVIPATPANGSLKVGDAAAAIPNALGDIWNLVKEGTYGTAKKIVYDIPKAAIDLVKEQGVKGALKNLDDRSVVSGVIDVGKSLIPQSAKEFANTDAIAEIPTQFKALVKENGGSYAKALLATIKAAPGAIPSAVQNYADQIDRARQSVENHPVNEFLGYLGLKSLAEINAPKTENTETPTAPPKTPSNAPPKSSIIAPFKSSYKPGIANLFDTEGIKAPVSAISDSPVVRGTEAVASKGVFGAKIADTATNALSELEKRTNDIVSRLTPDKAISDENLGKTIQEGLKEYNDNFKVTQGKIYDQFSKTYGDSNVFGKSTKDALSTLIDEQKNDQFGGTDSRFTRMLTRITGSDDPQIKEIQSKIKDLGPDANPETVKPLQDQLTARQSEVQKSLTFDELKSTRSSIGQALEKEPTNTYLKRLYGAVTKDMESAIKQRATEDPLADDAAKEANAALDKLNKGYALGKNKIESNISQSIEKSNPESIAKNLIKRNSADTISQVKEMIGQDRFAEVQKSFMRGLFEDSTTREKFDVSKLENKLSAYDQNTLDELMTPEQQKEINEAVTQLKKYETMTNALKTGKKMAEGSQTAFVGKLGALSASIFSGNFALASGIIFGDLGLKTLFSTDFGRKILTEGLSTPNLKALEKLQSLSEADKQFIIQNMRTQNKDNK